MQGLTPEQMENRDKIKKGLVIGSVLIGAAVALFAYWMLDARTGAVRSGGAVGAGVVVGVFMYWKNFRVAAAKARCSNCGEAFSVRRTDRTETLTGTQTRRDDPSADFDSGDDDDNRKTYTYDVVETYTCDGCGYTERKEFTTTRRHNGTGAGKSAAKKSAGKNGGNKSR